ncbi:hypothetical protein TNCT_728751 [Trichonephila clavata]|uniref:Uncharacterized protein n=1 Tax=Trichonephila clavata TaxID=2740835 RepID=A0A8X6GK98_TRICU|nr:hypothetical protein TNCT_728751 [Trichonephila clavata]
MKYGVQRIKYVWEEDFRLDYRKNDLILLNDKSPTYLHSSGIFTSIDLSLSSINLNYDMSWSTNIIEEIRKAQILCQESEIKQINSRAPWWAAACGDFDKNDLCNLRHIENFCSAI